MYNIKRIINTAICYIWSVQFSCSVVSDSLMHELQHARLSCPSLSPGVCSNPCPLSRWNYPTISASAAPFSFCLQSFLASGYFPMSWLKYWSWSFSISPSNEYSGLISFMIDRFDLLAVQGTLESSPELQLKSIYSSALSLLYGPALTSVHDYWTDHSLDYMDLCR